jgi:DUF4097 and DUF4098 domain-containing protein YvlB
MAADPTRRSSLFSAFVLIFFGLFFLLHYYRGFQLGYIFTRWWPVLLILWGASLLYGRSSTRPEGAARRGFLGGREIALVFLILLLLVGVNITETIANRIRGHIQPLGSTYPYDLEVASRTVPPDAHVTIRNTHGNIHVRPGSSPQIRVSGRKNVTAWTESEARRISSGSTVEIAQEGSGYEIRPAGSDTRESRIGFDLDVELPPQSSLTIRSNGGDIEVSDLAGQVSITSQSGDIEVRDVGDDVSVGTHHGDVKVSGIQGNIKVSGTRGEVDVSNATGSLTLDGEFYGSIRAEKILKGVRFLSHRTDLALTELGGRLEISPGNFEISNSTGNLTITTNSNDLKIENVSGRLKIDNRNANVQVRFASPPKEDVVINDSSASIVVTVPSNAGFEITADTHSGDIDTEFQAPSLTKTVTQSGDSHLEGKLGARGPKIILKTSYGSISLHKGT